MKIRFDSILSSAQMPSRIGCIGLCVAEFLRQKKVIHDHNIYNIYIADIYIYCIYTVYIYMYCIVYIKIYCVYMYMYISFWHAKPLPGCNLSNWWFSSGSKILKNQRLPINHSTEDHPKIYLCNYTYIYKYTYSKYIYIHTKTCIYLHIYIYI